MSFVVSFAHVLRLRRGRCQPKRSDSSASLNWIAAGLTNCALMVWPHSGCLPLSAAAARMNFLIFAVLDLLPKPGQRCSKSLAHRDGRFTGFGLGAIQNLFSSERLFDGDFAFVPRHMTPTKCKKLRDSQARVGNQQHGNTRPIDSHRCQASMGCGQIIPATPVSNG